jgi:hypothetical protein
MRELPILVESHATFYTRRANVRLLDILVRALPRAPMRPDIRAARKPVQRRAKELTRRVRLPALTIPMASPGLQRLPAS